MRLCSIFFLTKGFLEWNSDAYNSLAFVKVINDSYTILVPPSFFTCKYMAVVCVLVSRMHNGRLRVFSLCNRRRISHYCILWIRKSSYIWFIRDMIMHISWTRFVFAFFGQKIEKGFLTLIRLPSNFTNQIWISPTPDSNFKIPLSLSLLALSTLPWLWLLANCILFLGSLSFSAVFFPVHVTHHRPIW